MTENARRIAKWCKATGWRVNTHMVEGRFLVSRPHGAYTRDWRVAYVQRTENEGRTIVVRATSHSLRNGALAELHMELACKGTSIHSDPTASLYGAPQHPCNALHTTYQQPR